MDNKKTKAILFDLDGTLINSLPYHVKAFHEILKERNVNVPKQKLQLYMGRSTKAIFAEIKKKYHIKESIAKLREDRRYHYFNIVGKRNLLFPDTMKTLQKIKKEYKIALVTSSSTLIYKHSAPQKLQNIFGVAITIDNVKNAKPHSEPFLKAARALNVKPQTCIVIGDAIFDMLAAKRAGMRAIGITTGYASKSMLKKAGADKTIRHLGELRKIMEK